MIFGFTFRFASFGFVVAACKPTFDLLQRTRVLRRGLADFDVEDRRASNLRPWAFPKSRGSFDGRFVERFGFDVAAVANAAGIDEGDAASLVDTRAE